MNRKSTIGFPTSYIDGVRSAYVISKSLKGWVKKRFLFFLNTIQFQSNKFCYKVSLCEKFQQQGL